ncbi:hypothetical protein [Sphingobacterium pedocola]|uniref:Uncharacterized protein n=1 Tax=Sphingobacterium pedocola TaxID=2082722 RepID=A0ABR9TBZ9_9SPHI|nr:hypothetical protein [Sphingobacterium pedocola]MBE8722834.1 hypothetical protein [Sphingobacterium pedocola]
MATLSFEIESSEVSEIRTVLKVLGAKKIKIVQQDGAHMSRNEFFEKINSPIKAIENGKGTLIKSKEELTNFWDSL